MGTDETSNGFSNRETWAANLWLTNDEGLYEMATEAISRFDADEAYEAGEALREWWEGIVEEFGDTDGIRQVSSEIGSLWRVDWQEVAEGLIED